MDFLHQMWDTENPEIPTKGNIDELSLCLQVNTLDD